MDHRSEAQFAAPFRQRRNALDIATDLRAYTLIMSSPCYCALLRRAARRMSADYDAALAPFGINIAQFALLRTVKHQDGISLSDLGRSVDLDRSTIGRNVRVLERMALMRMIRSDADKREAVVALTEGGTKLIEAAEPAWQACQRTVEERFGKADLADLRTLLDAM